MSRLTSAFFVSAAIRRAFAEGAFAAVARRGAEEAGAIFIVTDRLDGTFDLYAPVPQSFVEDRASARLFERRLSACDRPAILEALEREARFDPDLWIVEIEDRGGRAFVDVGGDGP